MSQNGRRRFRKMNARFRQRGSEIVRDRARNTTAGKARKLVLVEFWGRVPLPLPAKTLDLPRSLVGMTMGARKRAALLDLALWHEPYNVLRKKKPQQRWMQRLMVRQLNRSDSMLRPLGPAAEAAQRKIRTKYRIGERLRPCPGCEQCGFFRSWRSGSLRWKDIEHICDGSGVLPARGKGK